MEMDSSFSLRQLMDDVGLVPSVEEETKRTNVVNKLKKIVMEWAKRVSYQRQLPTSCTEAASATIMTYGSYGLGVNNYESGIDALCVGPCFASTEEDFLIVLRNIIASKPEVSDLHCVNGAKVPVMRFSFDGISIDLSYAKLNTLSVPEVRVTVTYHIAFPEDIDLLVDIHRIDELENFSCVFANNSILQLVPNLELYRSLLRFVKHWANRRSIYANLLGFFGGVHLAVLTAVICQRHPEDPLCTLISVFFQTFAFWPWPKPVSLDGSELPPNSSPTQSSLMPIQLPCGPYKYCHSNITRSTFNRIRAEFLRGHALTKDALHPDFDWKNLLQPFLLAKNYLRLIKIRLSSAHQDDLQDWVGFVTTRIHYLLVKLEEVHSFCDPNPTQYVDYDFPEPNRVFYWGLHAGGNPNIDHSSMKEDFMTNMLSGHECIIGTIELSVVKASDLPSTNINTESKNIKACWRIVDKNEQKFALYSKHAPKIFVGYLATDNENDGYM